MNFGESSRAGGSSSSGLENGASSSYDHPHKKARFLWQIKGKHHLKDQANITESPTVAIEEPETDTSEQSFLVVGPTIPKDEEAVMSLAEESLLPEAGNDVDSDLRNPYKNKRKQESGAGPSNTAKAAVSSRDAYRLIAEYDCISRWQTTQIAIGCFENKLNSVLEQWKNAPASADDQFLACISNLQPSGDTVENEAILMAISAHGLQLPPLVSIPAVATRDSDFPIYYDYDSSVCSEDLELSKLQNSSPWPSDEDIDHQNQSATSDSGCFERPMRQQQIHNNYLTGDEEFINTAVIQAIQSKGLMAAATDFG